MSNQNTFKVQGMDCANCAKSIEKGVGQLSEVQACQINFTTETLRVTGDVPRQTVIDRVRRLGFDVVDDQDKGETAQAAPPESSNFLRFLWQRLDTRLALLGAVLILPGVFLDEIGQIHHPLIDLASMGAFLSAGFPIARSAWRAVTINREININVLMTIAAVGAIIIGAYTEAGMVMVLFAIGEALEGYTAGRARASIRSLMQVVPNRATRLRRHADHTEEEQVNVADLRVGDLIVVKPGERIPMDGVVRAGLSAVNQAPITGESKLIEKAPDTEVFASSINGEGVLEIEVTHLAEDNTISRLIKMVEEAQEKRAPSQRFIDRFAKYYTPAVVVLALLVAIVPPLFFGQPFWNPNAETFGWLYRALALLVVACPCALVISTPVSIISAISNAASQGVLIKGGAYLETLSGVKAMAFDKTGTLTAGRPNVVALRSAACEALTKEPIGDCQPCNDVLALAAALERRSEHPLAQAVISQATRRGVQDKYPAGEMVKAMTGQGISGQVDGQDVLIGSHTYFDTAIPHSEQDCQSAHDDAEQGYTSLMIGSNGKYLGTIAVADTVRPSSQEAIALLKQAGLKHLVMLTGDNPTAAQKIAEQVGVTDFRAELLPEHKVEAVQTLRQEYGSVAMIGDGINDAPALATADVGLAVGGAAGGTTQAMETADITLMSDDLRRLAFTFNLSRATMGTIGVNIFLSIAIKVIFLILVLAGLGTMWMAVLADMGTSLLVTLNGTRLLRFRQKEI